jgi:RNA recognition motif-containing protein
MESAEEAINAIQALNGFEVNGRKLDVKIASPKANRPKKEEKPKSQGFKKPGGFGGQNRFQNDRRSGEFRSNDGNRRPNDGSQSSGERTMRPRRKFNND